MKRPDLALVPPFFHKYINLVQGDDLNALLTQNQNEIQIFLADIPEEKWMFRYAQGKWSIRELVQHLTDTERIFTYRALCFSRGETQPLPGFDENTYAAASRADSRTKQHLLDEWNAVRQATVLLFQGLDEPALEQTGTANNNPISVRAIGFIIAGHALHHKNVLQEKYLP